MSYVWRFQLRGIPVEVEPAFWIASVVLAPGLFSAPHRLALWVGVVFVSVMLHEMGHALMLRRFRLRPSITLTMMGGQAQAATTGLRPLGDALVCLAGPVAGFALGVPLAILLALFPGLEEVPVMGAVLSDLVLVNIGWGLLNLLPILPLDGGQLLLALLRGSGVGSATRRTHQVSVGVAGAGLVLALVLGHTDLAIIAGVLGFHAYRSLRRGD